ncbi:myeloid differentiation primary response protein MyD88 [Cylas formicarius]|uniref:myeloid differentiation primary response protein MyD88 n=1 Tax=Cylas formicarius TaxID=197179 RepID=UPI002958BB64|nr:myeloid differentiation primary response protein MyD88 [Cylas formicarius]
MNSVEDLNCNIVVLRSKARNLISSLLNPVKLIRTEKGLPRDWEGLAQLCGIPGELMPSLQNDMDPAGKVLRLWSENSKDAATIAKLFEFLEELGRYDVLDDVTPFVGEDLKYHQEHPPNGLGIQSFDLEADKCILTRDDVIRLNQGLEPQTYDAFVLFDDDDIDFATELIDTMEKQYNMKFCVKERDLVVGKCEHDAVIKLISERCGRLIVIVSAAFFNSNANTFFYSVAQSIGIEQGLRKIIPCIYKDCGPLPARISHYSKLDFRRREPFFNSWEKLHDSLMIPQSCHKLAVNTRCQARTLTTKASLTDLKASIPIVRSVSNPSRSPDSKNSLKPALHKSGNTNENHAKTTHVKFSSSMSNLPQTQVPEDKLIPSTSSNNLGNTAEKQVKKSTSFYKKIINFGSKLPKPKVKCEEASPKTVEENTPEKKQKKEKEKKWFTLKNHKRKVALMVET